MTERFRKDTLMSMMNTGDILETIEMFTQDNLDVRTVTMGISLLDCIDPDPKKACEKIYNKITTKAADLVPAVEHISAEYGIPIINKRISVTPIAMLLGACPDADPVDFAKALDAAGKPYIKLVASNGLDERKIANMELYEHAHFDSYGVGENLITSASDPVFGGVYKLVAVKKPDGSYTPKMKCSDSASKAIIPGKKMPWRLYDENGQAQCDLIAMDGEVIEAGKPVTMVNLDSDAIERTITFIPTAVRPLLVPHILGGELAIELPSIAEKKAYIAKQLTEETWESELRLECPHKHYVNMTPAVAECRSRMYAELHGGKV